MNGIKQQKKPFRFSFVILILLVMGVVASCDVLQEIPPPLRLGTNVWPGYEPLYLARELGYYDHSKLKLVEFNSASDVIFAMRNGSLEAAALTLDEALTLMQDGISLKTILVMDFSNGGDVLLTKPYVSSLKALRGKKVAVENTAVGAVLLDGALREAGLDISDIEISSCTIDEHIECFKSADAVVTFEPVKTQLLRQGALQLFDSSQIPDRIVDVLVVREDSLIPYQDTLKKLLLGYFKAQQFIRDNRQQAAELMAPRMALSPNETIKAFKGIRLPGLEENYELLINEPPKLEIIAKKIEGVMVRQKLLSKTIDVTKMMDGSALPDLTQ